MKYKSMKARAWAFAATVLEADCRVRLLDAHADVKCPCPTCKNAVPDPFIPEIKHIRDHVVPALRQRAKIIERRKKR